MEAVLARYLLLLLAALTLFGTPARAATAPMSCSSVRDGQAGAPPALLSFMADAQDALLLVCRQQDANGSQASYELRGPRRRSGGACAFDAIAIAAPTGLARDLLANLPRTHLVYLRRASADCPAQDDPTYTQTQTQFGVENTDQFLWAVRSLMQLRAHPEAYADVLSAPKNAAFAAMLARNRSLPVMLVRLAAEAPSWRTVLNDPRVMLSIAAPQDPGAAGLTYTLVLEPTLGGFDIVEAGITR